MRSVGSLIIVAAIAACTTPGSGPALSSIDPPSGTSSAETPVTITGSNFRLPLVADLDHGDIDVAALSATIGGVPLSSVTQTTDATIEAVVPAGLPQGVHDVVVSFGTRTATLEDGYTVVSGTLVSTLSVARWLGKGNTFSVSMTITNNGTETVDAVKPSMIATSGTGAVTMVGGAVASVPLPPNSIIALAFAYTADDYGTVIFSGNATGVDATASPIASAVTMATADIVETAVVATDPFTDGSTFAYATAYNDQVYLGPNDTGTRAVRMRPSDPTSEKLSFTFTKDTTGNSTSNGSATYTSIGATGCVADTPACGPDNENGRGTFASGMLDGSEWLVIGGARSTGDLDYVYMTNDTDTTLDFRYVDLSPVMGAATRGFSAAYALNGRFYLGFPDNGGARPYFIALLASPPAPGLDTTAATAINLDADKFPGWQAAAIVNIDSMTNLSGRLFVSSVAGIMAATTTTPAPYGTTPTDWYVATPSSVVFTGKASKPPTKLADIFPSDRAFPQMATFNNRVYAGRNTTTGPQLWMCDPTLGILPDRCEPQDWSIAAANVAGDPALTQFEDASLTAISMVVATPQSLYVGFDSANGVKVFRSSAAAPFFQSDFQAVGTAGLGAATNTRILDGRALTFSTGTSVWITAGSATSALQLVVIP
ncbi:MAG TPA: IPT/TIG domain-containing protein [Kofleriaceae bacterium]|nr:IPT/TIG domain-containing protein [Kofleriaceae bacterium]